MLLDMDKIKTKPSHPPSDVELLKRYNLLMQELAALRTIEAKLTRNIQALERELDEQ